MNQKYKDQIAAAVQVEVSEGAINQSRLTHAIESVLDGPMKIVEGLVGNLGPLISQESALTIPLSDGCVAKVRFSGTLTKANLAAFSKIFNVITETYFVQPTESGASSGTYQVHKDTEACK